MNIQKAYDEWSDSYDTDNNLTRDLDQQVTRETLSGLHFNSILEIGCGTGKNTAFLCQIGDSVHALDFSQGMIEKAREKVRAPNVRFSMADITRRWPGNDGEFDLVVCNLLLEHIPDLAFIFSEAARVLQNKGNFFVNELHPFKQYEGSKARFYREDEIIEVEAFVHHISEFTNAATANGLTLVKLKEYWHNDDQNKPPRLISFLFMKT